MMIRINLLPYREEIRKAQRRQFWVMLCLAMGLGVLLCVFWYGVMDARIENQKSRNQFLELKIKELNDRLVEVNTLKDEINSLLKRKDAIESLQTDREVSVALLSELVRQTPGGIYLRAVKQTGDTVLVSGYTQSSSRVSTFMRNIDSSDWMKTPVLVEIKSVLLNGRPLGEFSLRFSLVKDPATKKTSEEGVKK